MNERIKELAEQAGFCTWADEHWNPGDVVDWSNRYDAELEKFAELIVKECITLFDGTKEMETVGLISHKQVIDQIKEHFRVK